MLSVLVNTFRVLSSPAMIVGGSAGGIIVDDAEIDLLPEEKRMDWTVLRRKYEEELMVAADKDFDASRSSYRPVRPHIAMGPMELQCFLSYWT
jgi:hypothetical protein